MMTMPVMFFAAVQCLQARIGAAAAGVMAASSGIAAARSGSARPARAAIRSGVDFDHPRVSSVAGENEPGLLLIAASARTCGMRRLLASARRVRNEPAVSRATGRTGTGSRRRLSPGIVTASPGGLAAGAGRLGGVVQADAV